MTEEFESPESGMVRSLTFKSVKIKVDVLHVNFCRELSKMCIKLESISTLLDKNKNLQMTCSPDNIECYIDDLPISQSI